MTERMTTEQFRRLTGAEPLKLPAADLKRAARKVKASALENAFLSAVHRAGLPEPEREYCFHPVRKWRFDFAWPAFKIAVEIHGGQFVRGGHSRGARQAKDQEKANEAARLGWRVLTFGTKQMKDPDACAAIAKGLLTQ